MTPAVIVSGAYVAIAWANRTKASHVQVTDDLRRLAPLYPPVPARHRHPSPTRRFRRPSKTWTRNPRGRVRRASKTRGRLCPLAWRRFAGRARHRMSHSSGCLIRSSARSRRQGRGTSVRKTSPDLPESQAAPPLRALGATDLTFVPATGNPHTSRCPGERPLFQPPWHGPVHQHERTEGEPYQRGHREPEAPVELPGQRQGERLRRVR